MFARNQWVRLSVVLLIALLAKVAWGEGNTLKAGSAAPGKRLPFELSIGPGIVTWQASGDSKNGNLGAGNATGAVVNLGFTTAVSSSVPLQIGADFGLGFLSVNPAINATYIRLTPTVIYKFDLAKTEVVHPYFGLSVGPNVTILSVSTPGVSGSNTKAYLEMLTRLGVGFDLNKQLSLSMESKLGTIGGDLIFMPSAVLFVSI